MTEDSNPWAQRRMNDEDLQKIKQAIQNIQDELSSVDSLFHCCEKTRGQQNLQWILQGLWSFHESLKKCFMSDEEIKTLIKKLNR